MFMPSGSGLERDPVSRQSKELEAKRAQMVTRNDALHFIMFPVVLEVGMFVINHFLFLFYYLRVHIPVRSDIY